MRAQLFLAVTALAGSLATGCKWSTFDDLEGETWVRSIDDAEVGSTDYAVAIVGVSTGTSGGTLAVASDDTANYSTVEFTAAGGASVGGAPIKLGTQFIGALSDTPVFVADATGRIALVERSINAGNFALVYGSPSAPAGLEFMSGLTPTPAPDAGTWAGNDLVFAAGDRIFTVDTTNGMRYTCTAVDHDGMPLQTQAMAADATDLWVWTDGGALVAYPLNTLKDDTDCVLPMPAATSFETMNFMPAPGARIHLSGSFAILAGKASSSRAGSVYVVNVSNPTAVTQVGTTLMVDGLRSSTLATLEGSTYLVLGVPDRTVDNIIAGEVELHGFTPSTGALDETVALALHDAEPESGQLFGRTVATMSFNGSQILVVGGNGEVFAYYRTALYDHLP